jgi:hypothetical protein
MRIILISIMLLLFTPVFSQKEFKKIRLGISYSPAFSYRKLNYSESDKWVADLKNDEEIPKYGYSCGINLLYNINEKFAVHTGILYSDKGEKTKPVILVWTSNNTALPIKSQTTFHNHYFDIPFQVNYYLADKKIKWYVTAGVEANKFIFENSSLQLTYSDTPKNKKA